MQIKSIFKTSLSVVSISLLSACYVVPIQPTVVHQVSAPIAPITFTARLYPTNEAAVGLGSAVGVVTNDLNGRGRFSVSLGGEDFQGEATRSGPSRQGVANASGNRGNYLSCTYQMSSATLGVGQCTRTGAAAFSLHIGN